MQLADGSALLATKLYLPRSRPDRVDRPRLLARLDEALLRPLTLICAPPGFGKTTLLSEWIPRSEKCVAWLSLDETDNDPAHFWAYFIGALQTLNSRLGEHALSLLRMWQSQSALASPESLDAPDDSAAGRQPIGPGPVDRIESILTALLNDIAAFPDAFALVLDDYHVITARAVHEAVSFLIDHLPGQMRLILTSRLDPPLRLARWRARSQLTEIRSAELRFTPDEATAFLNQVMGLHLAADDVATLEARTEGWIAGLQLAALAMRDRGDRADFIASFTGSNRYIVSYLVEEVLASQPENVQEFLLQTSILDRMTAALCDAVLATRAEAPPAAAILDHLERANLFLVPLDDEHIWFRYHHLFGEVLRSRLSTAYAGRVPELYVRAAEWFECNESVAEAVRYALAAKDWERAVRLMAKTMRATAFTSGQVNTVLGWLQALPVDVMRSQPRLILTRAWMLLNAGSHDAVEEHLVDAERALAALEVAQAQKLQGEIAALRAVVASYRREISRTIELCRQARDQLPEDDAFLRAAVAHALGIAYRFSGRVVEASQAFSEAIALGRTAGNLYIMMDSVTNLASMQMRRGQLRAAAQTCRDALQFAGEQTEPGGHQPFDSGFAHIRLGTIQLEWNDLDRAAWHMAKGIELGRQGGNLDIVMTGHGFLARVKQAQGDQAGAREAMETVEQMARVRHNRFVVVEAAAYRARLALEQGEVEFAARWAQGYASFTATDPAYLGEFAQITVARVRMAEKQFAEAFALLERLRAAAETAERVGGVIEILALQALTLQAQGKAADAVVALERALTLAEPEGYVRVFVDEGEPMKLLLERMKDAPGGPPSHGDGHGQGGRMKDYALKLLSAFGTQRSLHPSSLSPQPLIEPLSERELEVLRLIEAGLSNQAIAQQLVVAVSTVKKHINSLYGKLSVQSRTQALARARELGLL
jgi:LuxR family maltose regulon positive regulatory protein